MSKNLEEIDQELNVISDKLSLCRMNMYSCYNEELKNIVIPVLNIEERICNLLCKIKNILSEAEDKTDLERTMTILREGL